MVNNKPNNQEKFSIDNYFFNCKNEKEVEELINQGKYNEAKENVILSKINEPNTEYFDSLAAIIELYSDNYDEAKELFNSYISMSYDVEDVLDALTKVLIILYKKDEYDNAIEFCEMGINHLSDEIDLNDLTKVDVKIKNKVIKFLNMYKIVYALNYQTFVESDIKTINTFFEKVINKNII